MQIPAFFSYRFLFSALTPVRLPPFTGSTWRGAFGDALKRTVCVMRGLDRCETCVLYRHCAFPELFAPPRPASLPRRYGAVPPPFVFAPEEGGELACGEEIEIELRLIGKANRHLPFVVHALQRAAAKGMGKGRGRLQLRQVEQLSQQGWHAIGPGRDGGLKPMSEPYVPPAPEPLPQVRIAVFSPLRLKRSQRNVAPEGFDAEVFLTALLRRILLLAAADGRGADIDWAEAKHRMRSLRLAHADLGWREVVRRSARQGLMRAGGIVGSFELHGDLAPFWQPLWFGQWLHLGHLACMGLGAYRLEAAKLGDSAGGSDSRQDTAHEATA